jgi:hypothetical protein
LDFDAQNRVIGIEIEDAKQVVDFSCLEVSALPIGDLIVSKVSSPGT